MKLLESKAEEKLTVPEWEGGRFYVWSKEGVLRDHNGVTVAAVRDKFDRDDWIRYESDPEKIVRLETEVKRLRESGEQMRNELQVLRKRPSGVEEATPEKIKKPVEATGPQALGKPKDVVTK